MDTKPISGAAAARLNIPQARTAQAINPEEERRRQERAALAASAAAAGVGLAAAGLAALGSDDTMTLDESMIINPVDDQLSAKIACLPATHAAAHRVGWSSDWISIFDDHAYAATPDGGTRKIRRFYGEPRRLDPAGNAETADFLCCEWRAMTRLHVPEVTADTWYRLNGGCPPVTADMWRRLNGGRR